MHRQESEPRSLIGLALKVAETVTADNVRRQREMLREGDEIVTVDTRPYSMTDFAESLPIVRRGREAARAAAGSLKRLSVDEASYAAFLARQRREPDDPGSIDFVRVEIDGSVAPERVAALMKTRGGNRLDLRTLEQDIDRIYAIGLFQTVGFRLVDEPAGRGLVIRAKEKPYGPRYLRFALNASDDFQGGTAYTVSAEYSVTDLDRLGGEWTTEAFAGRTLGLSTTLHQPLDYAARLYLESGLRVGQTISDFYDQGRREAQYRVTSAAATSRRACVSGRRWRSGRVSRGRGRAQAPRSETWNRRSSRPRSSDGRAGSPGTGWRGSICSREGSGSPRLLSSAGGRWARTTTTSCSMPPPLRLTPWAGTRCRAGFEAGTSLGGDRIPWTSRFTLGGLQRLAGYRPGQISGLHYGFASLGYLFRVAPALDTARFGFHLGIAAEAGRSVGEAGGHRPGERPAGRDAHGGSLSRRSVPSTSPTATPAAGARTATSISFSARSSDAGSRLPPPAAGQHGRRSV